MASAKIQVIENNPNDIYCLKVSAEFLGCLGLGYEVNVCFTNLNGLDRSSLLSAYPHL